MSDECRKAGPMSDETPLSSPRPSRRRGGRAARRAARAAAARRLALPPGATLAPDEELAIGESETGTGKRPGQGRMLVIACGALAREIMELKRQLGRDDLDLHCLPAIWHNTPQHIPQGVAARIRQARAQGYDRILVAYGDCGTGGRLDAVLQAEGVERLPGPHCYAFFTGTARFMEGLEAEARTFFLTDYLVRHFDRLVWQGLMLDAYPELVDDCFGNYERLVYLAQTDDPDLDRKAREAAERLGLAYERRLVGYGDLKAALDPGPERP